MHKLFSTKGRLSRQNYIISCVAFMVLGIIVALVSKQFFPNVGTTYKSLVILLLGLSPFIYIGHCLTVKRLHDLNRPGSDVWQLNLSWTLQYRLFLEEGTYGKNQYGYPQSSPNSKRVSPNR